MERLQEMLDIEKHGRLLLDLKDVTLVGRAAVQFLARVEAARIRIVNCPNYVRTWIVAENRGANRLTEEGKTRLGTSDTKGERAVVLYR